MKTSEFHPVIQPVFDTTDRSAILIVPKEIYYNWGQCVMAKRDFFCGPEPEVFLIPGFKTPDMAELFLRTFYDLFFQFELKKWNKDPSCWPVNRTFDMFKQWFEIRVSCNVSDILVQPVFKESSLSLANCREY